MCQRRRWPEPMYKVSPELRGFSCEVSVKGRRYWTDTEYQTDKLAQENAAMRAFMVCQNFSTNDGMLAQYGMVQELPEGGGTRNSVNFQARDGDV